MRSLAVGIVAAACLFPAGCRYFRSTKISLPPGGQGTEREQEPLPRPPHLPQSKSLYQGWSAEQWGDVLMNSEDPNAARRASVALHILGAEGRPSLVQALESPVPENRLIALETITPADLRAYGDRGRRLLLNLAGDPADLRIRNRAAFYLMQWDRAAPAP
jgi:hypothetical protein